MVLTHKVTAQSVSLLIFSLQALKNVVLTLNVIVIKLFLKMTAIKEGVIILQIKMRNNNRS